MLLSLILVLSASAQECQLELENRFEAPFAVYAASATAVDETVVLIGGSTPAGVTGDVWVLEGLTEWKKAEAQVANRRYHGAANLPGRKVMVTAGYGYDEAQQVLRTTPQSYEADTAKLYEQTTAPAERYLSGVSEFGGSVYVAGGHQPGRVFLDRVDVYEPAGGVWSEGPALSVARDTALVLAEGRLYALGGFNGGDESSLVVERLSEDGTSWEPVKTMYDPLSGFSTVAHAGGIFTFGDYVQKGLVTRYDIAADTWSEVEADFTPRRHSAATVVGDKIVVVGGNVKSSDSWMATTEVFTWKCEG